MQDDFEALRADVETAKNFLYDDDPDPYISFVKDYLEIFDSFFMKALEGLDSICAEDAVRPEDKIENIKTGAYQGLQRVRQVRSALHLPVLPLELYYLLEDIKIDLGITTVIGLDPGSNPDKNFLIEKMGNRFRILKGVVIWEVWQGEGSDARVINLPRSELFQPLSYSLLAHECFHLKGDMIDEIQSTLNKFDVEIEEEHLTEMAVDLLSLNYMGPVYAERLLRIPNKIGIHESYSYPDLSLRIGYSIQYMKWLLSERGYDTANVPTQSTLDNNEYKSKFRELEETVYDELDSSGVSHEILLPQKRFNELQDEIQGQLEAADVPTYDSERELIYDYLGMPKATTHTLSDKLEKFLLDRSKGGEIALPIKPILLLNLLLLIDDIDDSDLQDVIHLSFKKWFVTRRTMEEAS